MARDFPRKYMGVVSIIFDANKRVLLVKSHSYGRENWELPGGWVELNESIMDAAVREVREETGLKVQIDKMTGIYYDHDFDMHHFAFTCIPITETILQPDLKEVTECAYWDVDNLPRPINDFTILRIEDALIKTNNITLVPKIIKPRKWLD